MSVAARQRARVTEAWILISHKRRASIEFAGEESGALLQVEAHQLLFKRTEGVLWSLEDAVNDAFECELKSWFVQQRAVTPEERRVEAHGELEGAFTSDFRVLAHQVRLDQLHVGVQVVSEMHQGHAQIRLLHRREAVGRDCRT